MKPPIGDLIWFGIRMDTGRPILERVEKNRCRTCKGFGTYGNPLCGALYLCKKCKGTGHNSIHRLKIYLRQFCEKIATYFKS